MVCFKAAYLDLSLIGIVLSGEAASSGKDPAAVYQGTTAGFVNPTLGSHTVNMAVRKRTPIDLDVLLRNLSDVVESI